MAALKPGIPVDPESCRDGRDIENGRDLEVQPLVQHLSYDPNSRWQKFKMALVEPPKSTVSIYADIPFNHAEWKRHRNAAWRHRPQPILFMRVAGGFWWQLTYTFIVSLVVGLYHHHFQDVTSAASRLSVPFNLTTFALSLLLVFRTNSSYSRWWEARMVWGAVVNLSRNFARQSLLWLPPRQARVAVRWMMAAPFLLKCHLRFNASVRENVSHILLPKELDWVLGWTHRPNAAAHVLSTAVVEGRLDTNREKLLTELVDTYIDCVGKCERIFKTPIPAAYTRHTSRYLMIYLTACPLVLWPSLGWWTLIASVLITFLLLGTENIGVQLEEPFRVLPLDDMCRGIEATLREMERHHSRLGDQYSTWVADPAGLSRASSESSLDSFQDGPADGPSEPAALNRFHHIPPPARLSAAAQALLPQGLALLTRRPSATPAAAAAVASPSTAGGAGGAGGSGSFARRGSGSGDLSSHHHPQYLGTPHGGGGGSASGGGASLIGGLLHHMLHPLGGSSGSGRGGAAAEATPSDLDLDRARGSGGGGATPHQNPHYPHHVHHVHRRLPHHPADVPSSVLAAAGAGGGLGAGGSGGASSPATSPFGSNRWNRVSFDPVAGPAGPASPPRQPAAAALEAVEAQAAGGDAAVAAGAQPSGGGGGVTGSPFARESQQQRHLDSYHHQQQQQQQQRQQQQQQQQEQERQGTAQNIELGGSGGGGGRQGSGRASGGGAAVSPAEPGGGAASEREPLVPKE